MTMSDGAAEAAIGRVELTAHTALGARGARRTLRRRLEMWECERVDDALLVFSELVSNAVRHGGGAARISVVHGSQVLRFEVHDASHDVPAVRSDVDELGTPGGVGLRVVDGLSHRWGWTQRAAGKVVWCEVPCCPHDDDAV
jgi:anti-sigma regulatory factor (Ser/Thr protein kinase)